MSDSPGLVDSAIGLVNSVTKSLGGHTNYRRTAMLINFFFGLVGMTVGLVNASCSLPFGQPVKLTFFVL